jgi:menaquinone-9 beta-reductase
MQNDYDLVIAGGGIAGAALGIAAKREGARVFIVEAERTFRDRVRGEMLHPWGVAEIARLGLLDIVRSAPAQVANYWDTYVFGMRVERRDLAQQTPARLPVYNVHHPELQTALLTAAEASGVHVMRGAKVTSIEPGPRVTIELTEGGRVAAQLAVIADGRGSPLRKQLGIEGESELSPLLITGVLLEGVSWEESAIGMHLPLTFDALALMVPLARARVRLYVVERRSSERRRYSGTADLPVLLERCREIGVAASALAEARAIGPLATFDTTCQSLGDRVLPPGVALLGDAAGNVDPVFGCGQSLALRDVRTLIEAWREHRDLQLAAASYARQRAVYHASLLRLEAWLTRILYTPSPGGDALRAAAGPRLPELGIDLIGVGPDSPSDPATEARLFAGVE